MRAVILDLDGVYFTLGTKNFIKCICELGVSEKKVIDVYVKSDIS